MIRSMRCLMRWYLSVKRLSEWRLSRWSCCIIQLRQHRLRKCGLQLNTPWLEWRNVKLELPLLIATLRVYSTLHISYLGLLLYSGMWLSLFLGLCWYSLCSPNLRTIGGLLKFHLPHRLIISSGDFKISLYSNQRRHPWILWWGSDYRGVRVSYFRNMRSCASSSSTPSGSVSHSKLSQWGMPHNRRPHLNVRLVVEG